MDEGTFGRVAKYHKPDTNTTVAVKMIRDEGNLAVHARFEKIQILENYISHLVQWLSTFIYMGYVCLEFEYLDKNLFDFMKERHFEPLQVLEVRPIVCQIRYITQTQGALPQSLLVSGKKTEYFFHKGKGKQSVES
ncbi:uncharacterized protein LOC144068368 isoform X2 [Stigmatopora argus]